MLNLTVEYKDELVTLERIGLPQYEPLGDLVSEVILSGGFSKAVSTEKLTYGGIPLLSLIDSVPPEDPPQETGEIWYHGYYGPVRVIAKYSSVWKAVALGDIPLIYDENRVRFDVDPDEVDSSSTPGTFAASREYLVYPSELFLLEDLIAHTPKSDDFYIAQPPAHWDEECCVDGFLQVIADLPCGPMLDGDGNPKLDSRGRTKYEPARVLVKDERDRYFITLACWLLCISNGLQYKWEGRRMKVKPPAPKPPFAKDLKPKTISVTEIMEKINRDATYWQFPYTKAADLDLEIVGHTWSGIISPGKLVGIVYIKKGDRQYKVPVYLSSEKRELEVPGFRCSNKAKDLICRYLSFKYAERKLIEKDDAYAHVSSAG